MPERCIAHLDMDAFYVSVELRRRPELRGQPVIVAGGGPRAVVTTASYEARRFGVGSAMPAARARRLCPDAVLLAPDFPYYRETSRQVMSIVRAYVDTVEVVGLDEAYVDLSGLVRKYGDTESGHRRMPGEDAEGDVHWTCMSLRGQPDDWGAARLGEAGCRAGRKPQQAPPAGRRERDPIGRGRMPSGPQARAARISSYLRTGPLSDIPAPHAAMRRLAIEIERMTQLGCSIGIGPSKLVAKVASDAEKPRGFVVLTRLQARERFAPAPCGLVPGIGPKTAERLRRLKIGTLGELAVAPAHELAVHFGARLGAELQRRARFEDDAPVTEERKVISESREMTFDHDLVGLAQLEPVLDELVTGLCGALVAQGRRGRTIGIKVRLDDFSTHTRARTLTEAVSDAERVGPIALELLRRFAPVRPVRLLGVRVAGLEPAGAAAAEQLSLSF